jgi:DNA-binding response OmpR family regulator
MKREVRDNQDILARAAILSRDRTRARVFAGVVAIAGWVVEIHRCDLSAFAKHSNQARIEMILIDWNPSDTRMLDQIRGWRRQTSVQLLVVGQHASEEDGAKAIEAGADDFISEPFYGRLFLARCWSLRRRAMERYGTRLGSARKFVTTLKIGPIRFDTIKQAIMVHDRPITLTRNQFLILERLAKTPGVPVTDEELVAKVLGDFFTPESTIARFHIHGLRTRLGAARWLIETHRPRSYCLVEAPESQARPQLPTQRRQNITKG